jgi:hypothetical protein
MQERLVLARHGLVRLCRAYYYCEHCHGGFFPLDTQLALGQGQMSNTVAALLARFATYMSFRAAAKELKEVCHIEVAPSTVQRYARAIGKQMNRDWQAKETHLLKARQPSCGPEVFTGHPAPLQQVVWMGCCCGWRMVGMRPRSAASSSHCPHALMGQRQARVIDTTAPRFVPRLPSAFA